LEDANFKFVPLDRLTILSLAERRILFWVLQVVGWLASVAVIYIASTVADAAISWFLIFRTVFGFLATAFLLRPFIRYLRGKFALHLFALLAIAALLAMALGGLDAFFTQKFGEVMHLNMEPPAVAMYLKIGFIMRSFIYGIWILLYLGINFWLDSRDELLHSAKLYAEKQKSDLALLRAQVNPHFLFNALNSILAVQEEPEKVNAITLALADYLRYSLKTGDAKHSLGEELDALESYLRVEKIRFGDKLEYTIEADVAARRKQVPGALVQPLLENAIKFGQLTSTRPLHISVKACYSEGVLIITVENTGHWVSGKDSSSTGIGLVSLRRRLELLWGSGASFIVETPPGRVVIKVQLPDQKMAPQ
jgi:signal transduction histidine kinase